MTPPDQPRREDAEDRRIHRSWLVFAGSLSILALLAVVRVVAEPSLFGWIVVALIGVVAFAAVRHRLAVQALERGRRAEAESFARILQGLSRSVSPDHIVDAIVEDLGVATGADHIVVVRRRPDSRILEATLVNARTGGPPSSTIFPISDLEDVSEAPGYDRRQPVAIPIEAGPAPALVASGAGVAGGQPVPGVAWAAGAATAATTAPIRAPIAPAPPAGLAGAPTAAAPAGARSQARSRSRGEADLVAARIAARARRVYGFKHTLAAPLTAGTAVIGAIVVSRRTADAWPAAAGRILAGAAVEASAALSRAYSHRQAEARAATDALTGLPNRRYFDEMCGLLSRRRRAEDAIGILMVDIDRFKVLNDTYGHGVGDEVLRAVAAAIAGAVREEDVPARFGGEEFAVLLRNPSGDEAFEVGERIREAVASLDLSAQGVPGTSVSVGVAVADEPGEPIPDIIERADQALFEAKRAGRNRVIAA